MELTQNIKIGKVNIISKLGIKLKQFYPNPTEACKEHKSDCSVRVLCALYGWDWDYAFDKLCEEGKQLHCLPDNIETIGNVLKNNGGEEVYNIDLIKDTDNESRIIADVLYEETLRKGKYAVSTDSHIFAYMDGYIYDNCTSEEFDALVLDTVTGIWRIKDK